MSDTNAGVFAAAELGNRIDKDTYNDEEAELRVELLNLQYDLRDRDFSVVILLVGDDRPGAIAAARRLHEWVDTRHIDTNIMFDGGSPEEVRRPVLWRYWSRLPRDGRISLFLGAWPSLLVTTAIREDWSRQRIENSIEHLARFERELIADGTLVLKFWFHLPEEEHQARLADAEKHPERYWQFEQRDWDILQNYQSGLKVVEQVLRGTSTGEAPWYILESTDPNFRDLTLGRTIAAALQSRADGAATEVNNSNPMPDTPGSLNLLDQIDLSASAGSDYGERLIALQSRLNELARAASFAEVPSVVVFEGVDAAGKGGTIRRIATAVPIQNIKVVPIAAPSEEERLRHYLWRFWRRLPGAGDMVIFDRSWYGRVLVERVEGFANEEAWGRAFDEINDFEAMLVQAGMPVIKFWLQIDQEEQLRRFDARAQTPYKKYKLTDEDYRNRAKWDLYQQAAHDMVARTSTADAPWHLLASNDKKHARLSALEILCDALEARLVAVLGNNWQKKVPNGGPAKNGKSKKGKKKNSK